MRNAIPMMLMMVALCAGLTTVTIWMVLGGSLLTAFLIYIASGQILMFGFLGYLLVQKMR